MVRSCSQPSIIAFKPIFRMRNRTAVYPFSRSPFKYASMILRSELPSISLRTIRSHMLPYCSKPYIYVMLQYCDSDRDAVREGA